MEFDYYKKNLEYIPCNLCGNTRTKTLSKRSVNDLKVNTVICTICGLIYINPRMNKADYDEYYMHHYRIDRAKIKNKEYTNNLDKNFENARKFGRAIVGYMGKYIKSGLTIDVGSSTGGILYGMREQRNDLELLGIEPSLEESAYAEFKGVKTIRGLFEDVDLNLQNKVSNILCVQSLNHLLDPKKFLIWAHQVLEKDGCVILAVKNWRHQVRRMGKLSSGVQIDHVYMFTPETLSLMCEIAGFKVVYMDVDEGKSRSEIKKQKEDGLNTHHIRIVAQKCIHSNEVLIPKTYYLKSRIYLWPLFVKLVYIFRYSQKLDFLRKILHID